MIAQEVFMDIFTLQRQGHSARTIAKKLGLSRNTVNKYLKQGEFPKYTRGKRHGSILDPYKQVIQDLLAEDAYQATWLFERIQGLGYPGGYDIVRHYVQGIKKQQSRLAYIRFETEPGRQAQMDWGDFQVREADGQKTSNVYLFVLLLGYSRAMYAEFVLRCTLEAFMDSHIRAFQYLGGVPGEILYDNMKNVVTRRSGRRAEFNGEFLHFAHHYQFQPVACPPYSPWVKGKVERPIHYIRERFWRGYRFDCLERANRDLVFWLNETANVRLHGTHRQPIGERWQQEIPHLGSCPGGDYDTSLKVVRKVYRDCQVSYNGNRYVVPHHVVGKKILLKIKAGTIRFYHDQELLATYQEPTEKGTTIGQPGLYERLLEDIAQRRRKYRARNGKGKATRGLTTDSLFPQVDYRSLAEYDRIAQGGAPWSN
jgi:transposase